MRTTKMALLIVNLIAVMFTGVSLAQPLGNPQAPQGGTYYVNLSSEPKTLNPITSSDVYASRIHAYVVDSLMSRNEDTYDWQPELAEKAEISEDGQTFTFTVRKGAKFHDGKPVTAEDVKFSFDVVFIDEFRAFHRRPYFENIEKAEIIDPHTVQFKAKNVYFGNFNAVAGLSIIPKHIYGNIEKAKKLNKKVIGSGPYLLDKYDKGKRIVLKRNKKWWGNDAEAFKGKNNFKRIILRFVKEENVALAMLEKGELDFDGLSPEAYVKKTQKDVWKTKLKKLKVQNQQPKGTGFVAWNLKKPLFQSRAVRVALTHLMNRELMNEKFRFGMSLLATGPWYQQSEYADPDVKPIPYDPAAALALLQSDGWQDSDKDGVLDKEMDGQKVNFEFTLLNPNKDFEKYLVLYQGDLAKVGVKMNLKLLEWNTFITKLDESQFEAVVLGWSGGSVDLDPKQIWHSSSAVKGGSNFIGYNNPEVDRLIDQARGEMDKQKRIPLLRQVYRLIAEDAPYAFMFNRKHSLYAHNVRIQKARETYNYTVGQSFWWIQPDVK